MRLRNTRENWGFVAKTLHWSAAAIVFAMLGLGLTMVHGGLGAGAKFEAYQLHKSTGFFVLAVMLVRGVWRIANPPPAPPPGARPWERRFALALHSGFYVLIAAMIASGWLMVSASPLPLPARLPGGFVVPNLTGPNALLEARTKFVHEVVAKLLIAAIGLHVAAALKHHFADKDTILLRMLPFCHDDRRP
jgi:cytochrome b561